jgi:hypothetical protein
MWWRIAPAYPASEEEAVEGVEVEAVEGMEEAGLA